MQIVSDLFLPALRLPHRLAVEVIATGPALGDPLRLPVSDGSVTISADSTVRAQVSVEVDDESLFPRGFKDPLSPYGSELRVRRGIRYPDGSTETVALGVFRIEEVALDAKAGSVIVSGSDRMSQIADERFTSPYVPARYTRHIDVLQALVLAVYPKANVELPAIASVVGQPVFDEDRAGAIQDLATAIGCDAYFDGDGTFVVRPIPPPEATTFVWEADASPDGVLTDASRRLSREGAYNGIVVRGQDTGAGGVAVSALAVDNRAGSPTLWGGPFGKVPRFYSSPLITKASQATSTAKSLLYRTTGLADAVDATCVPNPALEVGDPILVTWPDGTASIHLVESMTVPLGTGAGMTLRAKRAIELTEEAER